MRTGTCNRLAGAVLAAGIFVSACDSDSSGPDVQRGAVAEVELSGNRHVLYLQDLSGGARERVHFDGATDPFPENSPLVPRLTDDNLLSLGPLRYSPDGARIALVASLAFDQSEVVVIDADGRNARVASPNTQWIISGVEWAASGNQIAYAMSTLPHALGIEIFVTDLQHNRVRKVTTGAGWTMFSGELRFNADGSQLYYGRTHGEVPGVVPNPRTELRAIDLANLQVRVVNGELVGDLQAMARDGSWVLLLRNLSMQSSGRYDRRLVRYNLATGQETVLVNNGDIQYAELLPGDATALVVTDVSSNPAQPDYRYGTVSINGGSMKPIGGTGPETKNVAVHPDAVR